MPRRLLAPPRRITAPADTPPIAANNGHRPTLWPWPLLTHRPRNPAVAGASGRYVGAILDERTSERLRAHCLLRGETVTGFLRLAVADRLARLERARRSDDA